jgi:hypothetical protein
MSKETLMTDRKELIRQRHLYLRARQLNILGLLRGFGPKPGPRESVKDFLILIVNEKNSIDELLVRLDKGEAGPGEPTFMEKLFGGKL